MYERFLEQNTVCTKQTVSDALIIEYSNIVPESLITLWKEVGLGVCGNGLLRVINPADYQEFVNQYYQREYNERALPFMTTAFGDIFVWVKDVIQKREYVIFLNVRSGNWSIITSRIDLLFNVYIVSEEWLRKDFDLKVTDFSKLTDKLGIPKVDECFGYVPALALGGSKSLKNVQIVKMLPYIDIIAQTIGAFDIK